MLKERIVEMLRATVFAEGNQYYTAEQVADRVCAIVYDEMRLVVLPEAGPRKTETRR